MTRARKSPTPAPEPVEVDQVLEPDEDEEDDEDEEELEPGVCQFCGCTEERACPQGCSWTDEDATLCTVCEDLAFELGLSQLDRLVELEGPIDRWSKQR